MSHKPDDFDEDEDEGFHDPDAWLDSDFPQAETEEEEARFLKMRKLRHPPPTIARVHGAEGTEPIDIELHLVKRVYEVVPDGDEQVLRMIGYPDEVLWRGKGSVELIDKTGTPHKAIQPTLIRYPNSDPILRTEERVIPGSVEDYVVKQDGDLWTVIALPTKQQIYKGSGPVEVVRSPAPF